MRFVLGSKILLLLLLQGNLYATLECDYEQVALGPIQQGPLTPSQLVEPETRPSPAKTGKEFVDSLTPEQRDLYVYPYEHNDRKAFTWLPGGRLGIPLSNMSPAQRQKAENLLAALLTTEGRKKIYEARANERVQGRDEEVYYLTVYGEPGKGRWGVSFEGHHLSFNFTLEGDKVISASPFAAGSSPVRVAKAGPYTGHKFLAREIDEAFTLLKSLDANQKKLAYQSTELPPQTSWEGRFKAQTDAPWSLGTAEGIPASKLNETQRAQLRKILDTYLDQLEPEIRKKYESKIEADFDKLTFSWWGSEKETSPYFYRIQGPDFVLEHDASIFGTSNHIHLMLRDKVMDFGEPSSD